MFHDMFDVYPVDADIVARISFVGGYEKSAEDKIILLPVAWDSLDQGVCAMVLQGNYVRFDGKFSSFSAKCPSICRANRVYNVVIFSERFAENNGR